MGHDPTDFLCGKIHGVNVPTKPDAPLGADCVIEILDDEEKQRRYCEKQLKSWIGQGKLGLSQVAILSPHNRRKSPFKDMKKVGNWPMTEDLAKWRAGDAFLFSTIRSFKGLEADAVIMVDIPEPDSISFFTRNDFYVAASRAKHMLTILAKDGSVAELIAGQQGSS